MTILLYFAGLIIGVALFLYILHTYEAGKAKLKALKKGGEPTLSIKPEAVNTHNNTPRAPGERICPLCRSILTKYEALYATLVDDEGKKILIYGCRYCYKDKEDPDKVKKSDL